MLEGVWGVHHKASAAKSKYLCCGRKRPDFECIGQRSGKFVRRGLGPRSSFERYDKVSGGETWQSAS